MTEQLDQLFRMWDRGLCPGAQVLIRQHGKTLYEKCFGYGNLENKLKIHKESIFHVASISKEFTVMSILLLWKEGKLDLDDNIRKYLDEYINIETPITIRQMMNNVSGLRDQWELLFLRGIKINDQIDMDDINTTISLQKSLNFEPQSQYLYSNTGFHLLALIVEKLSQMSFPQFVKERIFTPLGMTHSFVRESFTQIVPDLTYSYQDEGNDTFYYNPLNYALYGPTSVNTCASDLCKVLDEYIHPNVIDPELIELMKKPVLLSNGKTAEYCGGLITHKLHGLDVFGHGGADALQRHAEELRSLAAGGLRGYDIAAQTVHRALQHHAANGGNAALQAHGETHGAKLCAVGRANSPLFLIPAQLRVVAHDVNKAADARHSLTEHGGKGRTERAHVEHNDAGKVQPDIQHTGHQQKIQRAFAVAQCTHQGAGHIIKQGKGDARKNGADIDIRKVDDVSWGVRPHQHQTGHSHRNDGEHRGKGDGQPHGIGGVAAHLVVVVGTEGP